MNKALHRFAVFTAVCTFFLLLAGGMVTSTGSGLAVPDWPLSYGQLMPPMVGGIFYEHGHRMIASFVGFLTVILAIWLWRSDSRRWIRILGFAALGAVILQGVLGGLTVLFLLPTPVSVAHASLAQSFFCLVSLLALFTSEWWRTTSVSLDSSTGRAHFRLAILLAGAVFVQLILGAVMRHTQSGLAIPDFPLSYGTLVPSFSAEALSRYNDVLLQSDIRIAADGPITAFQVLIHFLHRIWAVGVSILALSVFIRFRKERNPRLVFFSSAIPSLVVAQIALGMFTVLTRKDDLIATSHVAAGALILVLSVLLVFHIARLSGIHVRIAETSPAAGGVLA